MSAVSRPPAQPTKLSATGHTPRRTAAPLAPLQPQQPQQPQQPWTEDQLLHTFEQQEQHALLEQYYAGTALQGMEVLRSGGATQVGSAGGAAPPGARAKGAAPQHEVSLLYQEREIQLLRMRGVLVGGKPPKAPKAEHVAFRKDVAGFAPRPRFLVLQNSQPRGACLDYFDSRVAPPGAPKKRTGGALPLAHATVSRNERVVTVAAHPAMTSSSSGSEAMHFEFETSRDALEWLEEISRAAADAVDARTRSKLAQHRQGASVLSALKPRPPSKSKAGAQAVKKKTAHQQLKTRIRLERETEEILARQKIEAVRTAREKTAPFCAQFPSL
eukprot:COSAG06_NODE_4901_length_3872_cov_6065.039491_1_plen_329_part_00